MAETIRYSKVKALNTVMSGAFKYMLYNSHTQKFELKVSKESRIFAPSSLSNLDIVAHDFSMAKKNCVKLSGFSFLIFRKTNQPVSKDDEDDEIEKFAELRTSLLEILTKNPNDYINSLRNVRISTQREQLQNSWPFI